MAQDKRVFTGGMDKDSEPRLIKQGDYRDAKNIRNSPIRNNPKHIRNSRKHARNNPQHIRNNPK